MKKSEIISRLNELNRILNMDATDYITEWNNKHPEYDPIKPADAWAFRTGVVKSEIEWMLKK